MTAYVIVHDSAFTHNLFSFNFPVGVLSWIPAPNAISTESHLYDSLDVINSGITKYLENHTLGPVPADCTIDALTDPNSPTAWLAQATWWQQGIDLYE